MKKLRNIIGLCAFLMPIMGLVGCSGSSDTETDTTSLELTANRTSVVANGTDQVTFVVKYDGLDVSSRAKISVTSPSGEQSEISGLSFSTKTQGDYTFTATYEAKKSNTVTVTATAPVAEKYYRRVCMMDITSTNCTFCPTAARAIAMLQQNRPDRIIAMAFHGLGMGADPLATPVTAELEEIFPGDGYPVVIADLREATSTNVSVEGAKYYNTSRNNYPATCGIRLESKYNEANGSVDVTVGVTSNAGGEYRVAVFAVESGIVEPQKDGGLVDEDYIHNDVVRAMLSGSIAGDALGTLEVDTEVTKDYSLKIDEAWKVENMKIVAYVTDSSNYINNVTECEAANGSCDYKLNE